jgi:MoxR-like ATPase
MMSVLLLLAGENSDSTVQSLTLSASLRGGVVVWEESPLLRAVQHGRTLVLDEVRRHTTRCCVFR